MDSLSVIPNSIKVFANGKLISDTLYYFDFQSSNIIFKNCKSEKIEIKYRIFYYNFKQNISNKDTSLIVSKLNNFDTKNHYSTNKTVDDVINSDGLTKKGVFSRGVSVGNNQDPVVNSKLNLQLSGKLSNDLSVEAVITDESIPVQPDGNTAQIQDFNKVFIRVSNENSQLVAGDFSIQKPESYFLKYNKQVKGLEFSTENQQIDKNINLNKSNWGVAIAKGKYFRQSIKGIEGNQGPYKLQGINGETYIMIVSGSERVYIDGILLKRGENLDYTINYNSAEIIFTPKQPITKDSRIIVEFEYTERHYSRFTYFSNNQFSSGNVDFFFNIYSESDAKNQTIDMELTDEMKNILSNTGDSLETAFFQNIDSVEFDINKVLYRKVDTIIDSQIFTFYEYSTDPNLAYFQLNFSYIGENKGNYIIDQTATNGRIYKWVMPINGVPQGNYAASTILVSPKKTQMYDFGMSIPLTKKSLINLEFALSNNDKNLFSDKNDNDNIGKALKINFNNYFKGSDTTDYKSFIWADYEFSETKFTPIEIYKSQEFNRDWNINQLFNSDEHIGEFGYFSSFKKGIISAKTSSLYHSKEYFGINSNLTTNFKNDNNNFKSNIDFLYSIDNFNITNFARSFVEYQRKISKITTGINYKQETNIWHKANYDSLTTNSFMFHSVSFFVQNADTTSNSIKLNFLRRRDYFPFENNFKLASYSNDFYVESNFIKEKYSLNILINYRELHITDSTLSDNKPENNMSGRFLLKFSVLNKSLKFSSIGNISSGLEQKMQYIYIEVEPTKGIYTWIDYNEDGIKQIDEFEIANFSDQANFIRVPLQSNQYVKVFGKKITQSISFTPQNLFKEETKSYQIASKFNNNFALNIEHKSYDFNILNFSDSNAVNYYFLLNDILNIKLSKKLTLNFIWQNNNSTILMVNGTEKNQLNTQKGLLKYKITDKIKLSYEISTNKKQVSSDFSVMKNYLLDEKKNLVNVLYSNDIIDLSVEYIYSDKRNLSGNEVLINNSLKFSSTSVFAKKNRISGEINLVNNNFHGDASTTVAYSMLQGLKPDMNLIWLMNVKRNIGKTLQITFLYSGRYSQNSRIINTGSVNLVAFF